eukprot:TRINITY_DN2961_c0_g1_i1.p1 TRINITY_DN2961_c0_g1~~TRINITY_DN2961_c0_g1_i1.p1  ORF type:complete len:316 (+),score=42.88 TRINITY_DN2961_c0_g1_i1:67-1014(+)
MLQRSVILCCILAWLAVSFSNNVDAQNLVFTNGNVTFEVDETSGVCLCKDFKSEIMTQTLSATLQGLADSITSLSGAVSTTNTNVANMDTRVTAIETKLSQTLENHMQVFTPGTGMTVNVPAGAKRAVAQLYGAGGGGGPGQNNGGNGFGRPGASGAFCEVELTNLTPGTSQFVLTVGSGGTGATANSNTALGFNGGPTSLSFGGVTYSAGGGARGSGTTIQTPATTSGACKIARNGSVASANLAGIGGNTAAPGPYGGMGGSWISPSNTAVSTAGLYGGGGAPGYYYTDTSSPEARDNPTGGADGGIIIWWYPY